MSSTDSLAFKRFLKQYNMTGSEKADGYSYDVFIGLSDAEQEIVFDLLVKEIPHSLEWLFLLNAEKALMTAKDAEQRLRGNFYSDAYLVQQEIVKHSNDLLYQNHIIEDYPSYVDKLKPRVIDSVGRTPANAATVAFFKKIILTEVNSSAVARAAHHLLADLKIPRTNELEEENYSRLLSDLLSESAQTKSAVMNRIAKYEANLPVAGK
ncbi:hypothetical protein HSX11_28535 [Oxalobacteraceae bacterium]|nr:hypothetical protein [Oxalobacteraceae bacterium]